MVKIAFEFEIPCCFARSFYFPNFFFLQMDKLHLQKFVLQALDVLIIRKVLNMVRHDKQTLAYSIRKHK